MTAAGQQLPVRSDTMRDAMPDPEPNASEQRPARAMRPPATRSLRQGDTSSPELARLLHHLQTTVTRFVQARRAAGIAVDRVIPEVVCLVRESESCEGWRDGSERLMAQVVRWSIDAYHDAARPDA
jgi:hypothetical protein